MKPLPRYRDALLAPILITLLLTGLAWYAVGVLDRHACDAIAEVRFDRMAQLHDECEAEQQMLINEVQEDYRTRARIIAMMLSSSPSMLTDETSLEELRLVAGGDIVSVSDEAGVIRYSTDGNCIGTKVDSAFTPGLQEKNFAEIRMPDPEADATALLVGASRMDADGIIQIAFMPEDLSKMLRAADISSITANSVFLESGTISILNSAMRYQSHTDPSLTGSLAPFQADRFKAETGSFTAKPYGRSARVIYRVRDDHIFVCTLPQKEVYRRRNTLTLWMLALGSVLSAASWAIVSSKRYHTLQKKEDDADA